MCGNAASVPLVPELRGCAAAVPSARPRGGGEGAAPAPAVEKLVCVFVFVFVMQWGKIDCTL